MTMNKIQRIIEGNGKEYGVNQILNKYLCYPVSGGYYKCVISNKAFDKMEKEIEEHIKTVLGTQTQRRKRK